MGLYNTKADIQEIKEAMQGWTITDFAVTEPEMLDFHLIKGDRKKILKILSTDLGTCLSSNLEVNGDYLIFSSYMEFTNKIIYDNISRIFLEEINHKKYVGYISLGIKYIIEINKIISNEKGLYASKDYDAFAMCLQSEDESILEHLRLVLMGEYDTDDWCDFFNHNFDETESDDNIRKLFFEIYFPNENNEYVKKVN